MDHIVRRDRERTRLMGRFSTAYKQALDTQQAGTGARVSIHVSSDILEDIRQLIMTPIPTAWAPTTAWGFPLVEEAEWEPGRIVVRSEEEIW